jgi:hypothetical protein
VIGVLTTAEADEGIIFLVGSRIGRKITANPTGLPIQIVEHRGYHIGLNMDDVLIQVFLVYPEDFANILIDSCAAFETVVRGDIKVVAMQHAQQSIWLDTLPCPVEIQTYGTSIDPWDR